MKNKNDSARYVLRVYQPHQGADGTTLPVCIATLHATSADYDVRLVEARRAADVTPGGSLHIARIAGGTP